MFLANAASCCATPSLHTPPPLRRCPSLSQATQGGQQEWWECQFEVPASLFKFEFVVMDKTTGAVDNNKAKVGGCGGLWGLV